MDVDPDIAIWVLEFLLRQPLEDRMVNSLLRALPLPTENSKLQKLILLKKLESEMSRNSISESTLELLEQLEEIEFRQGSEMVSDAMKHAYCSVAVECTVKLLLKGFGGVELGEWRWKDEIEAAVWEDNACQSILKKSEGVNAIEAVNAYLREEKEKMGPSFLELVAEQVKNDDVLQGMLGVGSVDQIAGNEAHLCSVGRDTDVGNVNNYMQKGKIKLRDKLVGLRGSRGLASRKARRAKIVESDEMKIGASNKNYNLPHSPEVNGVRKALQSSSLELQAVVKDPLPDALRLAEAISGVAREDKGHDPTEVNHVAGNQFVVDGAGVIHSTVPNVSDTRKRSLMERNSSAHTYEWDGSQEDRTDCRGRLQLPSPRVINVSPLDRYEAANIKKRRKARKWSTLEEDTLRAGVQKYGKGNWKVILTTQRDIFEGRTEVDLKDKWRNLTRC
ncbi:telomere repeat-binding protein 2-like [Sesamum indicum]|uniref:Telomere repeat-binding protein 2-like n=1 Tax=Sesamum indicum TaxID=4182 RepID=A0A6I9U844_SESIN|nr:telomere repeat-binding protein 2-like [Sesamum indicum]